MRNVIVFLNTNIFLIIISLFINIVYFILFLVSYLDLNLFYLALKINLIILIIVLLIKFSLFKSELKLKDRLNYLISQNQELEHKLETMYKNDYDYFLLWLHQIKTPIAAAKLLLNQNNVSKIALKKQILYIDQYTQLALNYFRLKNVNQTFNFGYVDLDKIITDNLKKMSILFIDNKNVLKYQKIGRSVISDDNWLSIVIEQLLNNATKYTKNGEIEIVFIERENKLSIIDTGIGIERSDLPKIFNRGYCGLNNKSSGIGLYIVKEITKILNIELVIESDTNCGTKVSLIFPSESILHKC